MKRERKNNLFTQVPVQKVRRNLFDLSHEVKMSGKFGYLYPILCMETLPGDTVRDEMNALVRLAPMLAPVMHRIDVTTHFFFVPNRLLTDHWEDFITGGQDGTAAPVLPYLSVGSLAPVQCQKSSLWDYLGLPTYNVGSDPTSTEQVSVLPFRAAFKAFNDYYRDPNLGEEIELNTELEGDVTVASSNAGVLDIGKLRRGFEKDYFTSALPWAQRGAQVLMPLAGSATDIDYYDYSRVLKESGVDAQAGSVGIGVTGDGNRAFLDDAAAQLRVENIEGITFDNATTTINDFRRALALQKWMENNSRGGARYTEQIVSHFNVQVPDYRLQRAEYLGGGKQPVQISEVVSTARTSDPADPLQDYGMIGEMAGHGLSVGSTNRFTYRCQEHGFVIGFMSITMRTAYSQGIPRMFSRRDKFDFAWPELANLGEQEIKSKELFFSFDAADDDANNETFGYIPRYAEYKFQNDRIAGDFRTTLGFWHLGRNFTERPSLDVAFTTLYEDGDGGTGTRSDKEETFRRIFAVPGGTDPILYDYLWIQLYHRLTAKRPLPYFGVPMIG